MFDHNANNIHAMCGALPVLDKGTDVLQPTADHLQGLPRRHVAPPDLEVRYAGIDLHCYTSPASDQLSRDLIDAARDAKGG